jgi:methionyl-tRNA synthetase
MVGDAGGGFLRHGSLAMSDRSETVYVTTAIPFVNARPHLGFALEVCIADAFARHARSRGKDVYFVTGTDDHSLKNALAAEQAGVPTAQFVSEHAAVFAQLCAALQARTDAFVQTSRSPAHGPRVAALWRACAARGDLYRQRYSGLYCVGCERFTEPDETSCAEHATPLERVCEDNWFFRLSKYTDLLRERIEKGALRIVHAGAREETLALLRTPLRDLCVSRSAARARGWGLPVPGDPEQVIWVWFDALAYYLSALDGGAPSSAAAERGALLERFWTADGRRVHVIGKGITRFHALFWPAILESAGLAWPSDLLVHGYLTLDGEKISKSGRAFDPLPLLEDFGSDAVRYYLLRHVRTSRDGDWSPGRFLLAYNGELANSLGNLVNRLFGLVQRSNDGRVPAVGEPRGDAAELRTAALALASKVDEAVERFALDEALAAVFELVDTSNRIIDHTAPWRLLRDGDTAAADTILRALLETVRVIGRELAPFLPGASEQLQRALSVSPTSPNVHDWNVLAEGAQLPASLLLFPRREADRAGDASGSAALDGLR